MAIISLIMRNSELEIFIESGFSDGNHCLKAATQKIAKPFQLKCDRKHFAISFDFKEPAMTMTYKCLNQLDPAYLSGCFSKLSDSHTRVLRNSGTDVHIPRTRTSNRQKCFAYRGAKVWNDLDSETKLASGIQYSVFQIEAKKLHGPLMLGNSAFFFSLYFAP